MGSYGWIMATISDLAMSALIRNRGIRGTKTASPSRLNMKPCVRLRHGSHIGSDLKARSTQGRPRRELRRPGTPLILKQSSEVDPSVQASSRSPSAAAASQVENTHPGLGRIFSWHNLPILRADFRMTSAARGISARGPGGVIFVLASTWRWVYQRICYNKGQANWETVNIRG
ncbi:hypothetical protein VUR80DRAFT_3921 [Thermomyces stellatus]